MLNYHSAHEFEIAHIALIMVKPTAYIYIYIYICVCVWNMTIVSKQLLIISLGKLS